MKLNGNRKWTGGGIALSLVLAGGIAYSLQGAPALAADTQQQDKAQATGTTAAPNEKWHGKHEGKWEHAGAGKDMLNEAASAVGLTADELAAQLKGGKTLAEVAQAKGIAKTDLIAKLTAQATAKIDERVKSGKMTADQAAKVKANLNDKIAKAVDSKGLQREFHRGDKGERGFGYMGNSDSLAKYLGITTDDLRKELKAGKSLVEIAKAHNVTEDQLIAKIKEDMTPKLKKMVNHKGGVHHDKAPAASPSAGSVQ
jgi:ribosomal protein S13